MLNYKFIKMITNFESKNDVLMKLISCEIPYGDYEIKCTPSEREVIKEALLTYMIAYKKKFKRPLSQKIYTHANIGPNITLHWPEHYELTADEVFKNKSTLDFMRILKLQPGESLRIEKVDVTKVNVLKGMCSQKRKGEFSFKTEYPTAVVVTRLLHKKINIRGGLIEKMLEMKEGESFFFPCKESNMPLVRAVQNEMKKRNFSFYVSGYQEEGCIIKMKQKIADLTKFPMIKKVMENYNDVNFEVTKDQYEDFVAEMSKLNNKVFSSLIQNEPEQLEIDDEEDLL